MDNIFTDKLRGRTVIVGIGNPLRGDDGFGPQLIKQLIGKIDAVCIDAGTTPETYSGKLIKEDPDTILLVDAVHLNKQPGQYCLFDAHQIIHTGFTTHDISPALFIDYLTSQTKASIYMLGLQPETVNFGDQLSESVRGAIEQIIKQIMEVKYA